MYELEPGHKLFPYHTHHANEEWLLVVRGQPTLRTADGEQELQEGDVAVFRRGQGRLPSGDQPDRRADPRPDDLDADRTGHRRVPGQREGRGQERRRRADPAQPARADARLLGRRGLGSWGDAHPAAPHRSRHADGRLLRLDLPVSSPTRPAHADQLRARDLHDRRSRLRAHRRPRLPYGDREPDEDAARPDPRLRADGHALPRRLRQRARARSAGRTTPSGAARDRDQGPPGEHHVLHRGRAAHGELPGRGPADPRPRASS